MFWQQGREGVLREKQKQSGRHWLPAPGWAAQRRYGMALSRLRPSGGRQVDELPLVGPSNHRDRRCHWGDRPDVSGPSRPAAPGWPQPCAHPGQRAGHRRVKWRDRAVRKGGNAVPGCDPARNGMPSIFTGITTACANSFTCLVMAEMMGQPE